MNSPMKRPPITPRTPIATHTVFITNHPASSAIEIEKMTEATTSIALSIKPVISQKIRQNKSAERATTPAVTQGNHLLPNRATIGPPKIIKRPRTHGYSLIKLERFIALPAGQPALCATTTLASHPFVSTLTILGLPGEVTDLSQRTSVVNE